MYSQYFGNKTRKQNKLLVFTGSIGLIFLQPKDKNNNRKLRRDSLTCFINTKSPFNNWPLVTRDLYKY